MPEHWETVVEDVQAYRENSLAMVQPAIPDVPLELPKNVISLAKSLLSIEEIEITDTPPEVLLTAIAARKWSTEEVTRAFLRRAGVAQKLVNCVTELLPEQAVTRARALDQYLAENNRPIGPLHGLPISVKELVGMEGLPANAAFVAWADRKAEDDALILKILWDAGCVFFARTTEPQTLMHIETSSNLYGVTVNPCNSDLTSGGSSGGEGALLGLHGSCLGVGSDIGGSIRSPAAHNGVYGLKPTAHRLPVIGAIAPTIGGIGGIYVAATFGPLSTSLEGTEIFMKTIIAARPWLIEPSLVPLPWQEYEGLNDNKPSKKLKIGVMWSDGVVEPNHSVSRALTKMVNALKPIEEVDIVEWKPYRHGYAWELISSLYYVDGGKETKDLIESSGEPWRPLSKWILTDNPLVRDLTTVEIQELAQKRDEYRTMYAQHWNETTTSLGKFGKFEGTVDVILCPATPGPAPPLNCSKYWGYTSQWNLLDYPALVFPVTKYSAAYDRYTEVGNSIPVVRKGPVGYDHSIYQDAQMFEGMPIALQLIGRPFEDEKVVGVLKWIKERIELPFKSP